MIHQRHAIRQKQHPFDPIAAHQQIDQSNHRAGFATSGGHDQQRLALPVHLEGCPNTTHRMSLVIALDDLAVDHRFGQRFTAVATLNQQL
ncbi:hypothetical protein D3C85_1467270 [compost metagenome]